MTGSIYFYSGTISEEVYIKQTDREWVTAMIVVKRGFNKGKHDTTGAKTILNDFKKQEKRYLFNGDILPTAGSTAWQHQMMLGSLIELGGTFQVNTGSDGTYTGMVTKYKFIKRAAVDKYDATIEFLCGSSRG